MSAFDGQGQPLSDLTPGDFELKENGVSRVIRRIERDPRPLALALLVDASSTLGSEPRTDLAGPVFDFLASLPPDADVTLMTVGTPPKILNLAVRDRARAELEAHVPFGKLSIYDGLAEAARLLAARPRTRRVIVTVASDRFDEQDEDLALHAIPQASPIVLALQFGGSASYFAGGIDAIVRWSGGRYEQIGATSGVKKALPKLRPELEPTWLVYYETPSAREARRVEVKVKRKGAKARVRPAGL